MSLEPPRGSSLSQKSVSQRRAAAAACLHARGIFYNHHPYKTAPVIFSLSQ